MPWDDSMWNQEDDGSKYNDWGTGATPGETSWTVSDDSNTVTDPTALDNSWLAGVNTGGLNGAGNPTGYTGNTKVSETPVTSSTYKSILQPPQARDNSAQIAASQKAQANALLTKLRNNIASLKSGLSSQYQNNLSTIDQTKNSINSNANVAVGNLQNTADTIPTQYDALKSAATGNANTQIAGYNNLIAKAGDTYNPLMDKVAVQKSQAYRQALEQNSNAGDRGGVGRQLTTNIESAAGNDISGLEKQKQNYKDNAGLAIQKISTDLGSTIQTLSAQQQAALSEVQNQLATIEGQRNTDMSNLELKKQAFSQQYQAALYDIERSGTEEGLAQAQDNYTKLNNALIAEANRVDAAASKAYQDSLDNASQILANKINEAKLGELTNPDSDYNKQQAIKTASMQTELDNMPAEFAQKSALNQLKTEKSSTPSKTDYDTSYQEALSLYSGLSADEMYNDLESGASDIVAQIGQTNYNKLVSANQKKYYDGLISSWSNSSPDNIVSSLENEQAYYISRIGQENYNKLMRIAKSALENNKQTIYG